MSPRWSPTCWRPSRTAVAELVRRHGVSDRTLQRLFRDYVGVGPKWVLRRYRIHAAAERLAAGEAEPGAALALDLGYFDHFIRDFRAQIAPRAGWLAGEDGRWIGVARPEKPPTESRPGDE